MYVLHIVHLFYYTMCSARINLEELTKIDHWLENRLFSEVRIIMIVHMHLYTENKNAGYIIIQSCFPFISGKCE
jgi:hypothetical protein